MADLAGIVIGKGATDFLSLLPKYANRHGLIAGATGTGKTVTLQTIAEGLSNIGVSVFMADVKGDLAGLSQVGGGNAKLEARATEIGVAPLAYTSFPVTFWDLFGENGHSVHATISEMGPLLLSRLLDLNETQEGVLNLTFKVADDQGLMLLDLKDLRAMLTFVSDHAEELRAEYGNVTSTTIGAIQRQLLVLEEQGGDIFFGEPALELTDLIRTTPDGKGVVNILAADKLMQNPRLYATFLLWMLSELFENLPEVGDIEKPKLAFFFDEAHLLFSDASKALVQKVEQVVRLIRSKGVGVYFVTQHPLDIPDSVLGQLGNRVQHALRAFTPRDQAAVRTAAETFRVNPAFKTEDVITELKVGEALVSVLGPDGAPTIVDRCLIKPPLSRLGAITPAERQTVKNQSTVGQKYATTIDRESAYELLAQRAQQAEAQQQAELQRAQQQGTVMPGYEEPKRTSRQRESPVEAMIKSTMRSVGSQLGRSLIRGVLGGLLGGRRR